MPPDDVLAQIEVGLFRVGRITAGLRVSTLVGAPVERSGLGVLSRLADRGPTRLSELAGVFGLDLSTVSRQVSRLEAAGMVTRGADTRDARAHLLDITDAGRDVLLEARRILHDRLERALREWPARDREELARLLLRLGDDLGPDFSCLPHAKESK